MKFMFQKKSTKTNTNNSSKNFKYCSILIPNKKNNMVGILLKLTI